MDMKELVDKLNKASDAYYNQDREIMSNLEYDRLYDKLKTMEKESGIILPDSPTNRVGSRAVSRLEKVKHNTKMLSLDKTKDWNGLIKWAEGNACVLSWKLDGLTVVMTYQDGKLTDFVTRGNGETGERIIHNASMVSGVPLTIRTKEPVVVRGEAVITYEEFNRINETIKDENELYKNPRNLASGSIRQLNPEGLRNRHVMVKAFQLVSGPKSGSFHNDLEYLSKEGFDVVEHELVYPEQFEDKIKEWETKLPELPYPTDGLVFQMNDTVYGESLGNTGHHPRNGMAFKWQDTIAKSTIKEIFWSASRSGLINPVAVFEPVELEGTTVSRASVHNVSILKELGLQTGSAVGVYKANMIIPQISENLGRKMDPEIPHACPVCGKDTVIRTSRDRVETLWCENQGCPAKQIGQFERFVSRDAMNIEGLAGRQIEQMINHHIISRIEDLFQITDEQWQELESLDGFGKKSVENIRTAIENSRKVKTSNFLYALGIPYVGHDVSRKIAVQIGLSGFIERLRLLREFTDIEGIGEVINDSIYKWRMDKDSQKTFADLCDCCEIEDDAVESGSISGLTFVITGSVCHFANRDEMKALIESKGGKVSGSVSRKTSFLINNDLESTSGKNKKAKELGVPVISENDFLKML